MNKLASNRKTGALTLIEVLVVLAVLGIVVGLLLPRLAGSVRSKRIGCVNNLKQVGMAYHLWANDNDNKFPMQVSVTNGGTMELVPSGAVFPHYHVMSNELNTPKVVVCPQDSKRTLATNFTSDFNDTHVSYFVGVDADETQPQMWLAGDRNLQIDGVPAKPGLLLLWTNSVVGWTHELHDRRGNVVMSDGHVDLLTAESLWRVLQGSGVTNRLAIP